MNWMTKEEEADCQDLEELASGEEAAVRHHGQGKPHAEQDEQAAAGELFVFSPGVGGMQQKWREGSSLDRKHLENRSEKSHLSFLEQNYHYYF